MFDLEQAIADWRKQMLAAGIKIPAPLDELESHLREDVEEQMRSGLSEQQAFELGVRRIGRADALKMEFDKVAGLQEARLGKVIGIACGVFAGLFSLLLTPKLLTVHDLSTEQRLWGLAAVALTTLSIASWRFSHKYLPVIRNRRTRRTVGMACGLAGVVWILVFGSLLSNVIVPQILGGGAAADSVRGSVLIGLKDIPPGGLVPIFWVAISILWAMALMAILGGIAYGLEEAARRHNVATTS